MINSMTGFGSAKGETDGFKFSIEVKSVNNRYLDSGIKLPRAFSFAEEALKGMIPGSISRGKVDVFISVDSSASNDVIIKVNEVLADGYINAMRSLSKAYGIEMGITAATLSRLPDVLCVEKREPEIETIAEYLCSLFKSALSELNEMRQREGERLCGDILEKLNRIESFLRKIEERSPKTTEEYAARMEQRIRELLEDTEILESRIVMEAAIFADKTSVDEETVRLRSHLNQFRHMLESGSPVGRKLDFLTQELNREINTIGSKCNDAEMSRHVVDLKAELEKVREQIQNIE